MRLSRRQGQCFQITCILWSTDAKIKESIKKEIKHLYEMEENLEKETESFSENNPETKEDLNDLLSIKGIGVICAISLLYLFRKYPDANRNEITALAGLDPIKRQSGSSLNGGRRISRAGDPMLRKVLYLACMNSIQHNERIRMFYEHLITNNHKKPKVALVACMRKILLIAHQIYVTKSKYKVLKNDKNLCLPS
jgi:transposase